MRHNLSIDADPQQQAAASPLMLVVRSHPTLGCMSMIREDLQLLLDQASLAEKAHGIANVLGAFDRSTTADLLRAELARLGVWKGEVDERAVDAYVRGALSAQNLEIHFSDHF